jgi:hypothetical protein
MIGFRFDADDDDEDTPLFGRDMQAWSDSLENAGIVLGEAFAEAGMLGRGYLLRPAAEPVAAVDSFDPYDCTVLDKPMSVRRARITMKSRPIIS